MSSARRQILTDVAGLRLLLGHEPRPSVLDVRWALGDADGAGHYRAGHIPGAVYVDLDRELAAPPTPAGGRHPLPQIDRLQEHVRRWGVSQHQPVVVYDDNHSLGAARAWWVLRWAGIADVRILDGGLSAWTSAGGELETGTVRQMPGDVVLTGGELPTLDAAAAASLPQRGVLVDARAGERYRGESEPLDPRAGHIPGAISLPTIDNVDAAGRFLDDATLQARFRVANADRPVGVYCGSGVTAAHEIAALSLVGIDAALFPGSWSAWSADPERPAATGAGASGSEGGSG